MITTKRFIYSVIALLTDDSGNFRPDRTKESRTCTTDSRKGTARIADKRTTKIQDGCSTKQFSGRNSTTGKELCMESRESKKNTASRDSEPKRKETQHQHQHQINPLTLMLLIFLIIFAVFTVMQQLHLGHVTNKW